MKLKDKVALITGGGRGIGKAVASAYAREGARLAICARSAGEVEETAKEIQALGADCLGLVGDVSSEESVDRLVTTVGERFGSIDVLVNNAGVMIRPAPVPEIEVKKWDRRRIQRNHREGAQLFRVAIASEGNVNLLLNPQELLDSRLVEANHGFVVNQRHRRALIAHGQELFQRRPILTHVLIREGNALLRKKLFLPIARPSARLRVYDDRLSHLGLLSSGRGRAGNAPQRPF